jgi:ferredoxin
VTLNTLDRWSDKELAVKVAVDRNRCEGYGFCEEKAPEMFQLDEDGQLEVLSESAPEDQLDAVRRAVRSCPVAALTLNKG